VDEEGRDDDENETKYRDEIGKKLKRRYPGGGKALLLK
jgi:hypothetical protein